MFTRYCQFCDRKQKCHNDGRFLFCIECKTYVADAPTSPTG